MAGFSKEDLQQARQMDLLTYLQTYEPQELVHIGGNNYCTREHDSLKISNGMWHWFSRGIGGRSAIDYLVIVKEYSLPQAVGTVLGRTLSSPSFSYVPKTQERKAELLLPEAADNNLVVSKYLRGRGIHPAILDYCFRNQLVYETLPYHSAAFLGKDADGQPRYCSIRSCKINFKGEATGSNKHYSFNIPAADASSTIHVFESAIDLLSYASLQHMAGKDWRKDHLLSLAGVFPFKRKGVVPVALQRFLENHPETKQLNLHLDNDEVGRSATKGIMEGLQDKLLVVDEPPSYGKDVNDQLQHQIQIRKEQMER